MALLLYSFDHADAYPILERQTTVAASATANLEGGSTNVGLRVIAKEGTPETNQPRIVLALPPRAVTGRIEQLVLDVTGDASGARIGLDVMDALDGTDRWVTLPLVAIDFRGRRTCHADVNPDEPSTGGRRAEPLTPPVQCCRLVITLQPSGRDLDIVLHTLKITGDVHSVPTGIART